MASSVRNLTVLIYACLFASAFGQALDENGIWNANKAAVVRVRTSGKGPDGNERNLEAGVGIIVSADGYILTALHVVGSDEDWLRDPDGLVHRRVEITRSDGTKMAPTGAVTQLAGIDDLALIRANAAGLPHADLARSISNTISDALAIVWDPTELAPHPLRATVTNTDVNTNGDVVSLNLPVVLDGYSGSPVFDPSGKVIGLIKKRLNPARASAIPIPNAVQLLPSTITSGQDGAFPAPDAEAFATAQAAFSNNDCQPADQFLDKMSPASQGRPAWILFKARVRACLSDFAGALEFYHRYPEQAAVRDQIGSAQYQLVKQREAQELENRRRNEQALREAVERRYADWKRQARKLEFLERYTDELAYLKRAAATDSDAGRHFEFDIQQAEWRVDLAQRVVDAKGQARGSLVGALYNSGRIQEAIAATTARLSDASNTELVTIPDLERANLDTTAARKLNGSSWCFNLRIRGLSYYAAGRTQDAFNDMTSALERCKTTGYEGDEPQAAFYMAAILYDLGRFDNALKYADLALRTDPSSLFYKQLKEDITTSRSLSTTLPVVAPKPDR